MTSCSRVEVLCCLEGAISLALVVDVRNKARRRRWSLFTVFGYV